MALGAIIAAGCASPAGPRGWAGARPVLVESQNLILAAHKKTLYALPESTNPSWQFPPQDRSTYSLSLGARDDIAEQADGLGLEGSDAVNIDRLIRDLTVEGASVDALTDAIDVLAVDDTAKDRLKDTIETATQAERDALRNVKALYGSLGISDDTETTYVPTYGGDLVALDTRTGASRWFFDAGDPLIGGVAFEAGAIIFGTKGGDLFSLDAISGEMNWEITLDGEVWSTPDPWEGDIVATTLDGTVYRINAEDGAIKWRHAVSAGIAAPPVVAGGVVYVGSFDNRLYALDAVSGDRKWSFRAGNWIWAPAIVDGDTVYAASLDGKVYAVDASNGAEKWSFDTGAPVRAAMVVAGDGLVAISRDGTMYKLNMDDGTAIGAPVELRTRVEANLYADEADQVYVVPRNPVVYVADASGELAVGSFVLPQ